MSVQSTPDPAREGVRRVALVITGAAWVPFRFLAQFVRLLAGIVLPREFGRSLIPGESCLWTLIATSGLPTLDAEVARWPSVGAAHPDALGPRTSTR